MSLSPGPGGLITYSFQSIYDFTPEGEEELKDILQEIPEGQVFEVKCDPSHSQQFLLKFIEILSDYISTEISKQTYQESPPKVVRLYAAQLDRQVTSFDLAEGCISEPHKDAGIESNIPRPDNIRIYRFHEKWQPSNETTDLAQIFLQHGRDLIKEVAILTNSLAVTDWLNREVSLKCPNPEMAALAKLKLENIEKNHHKARSVLKIHLVEVENDNSFLLKFCPLKDLDPSLSRTTRFEFDSPYTSISRNLLVLRTALLNKVAEGYIIREPRKEHTIASSPFHYESQPWNGFTFRPIGILPSVPEQTEDSSSSTNLTENKFKSFQGTTPVPSEEHSNPLQSNEALSRDLTIVDSTDKTFTSASVMPRKQYGKKRIPKVYRDTNIASNSPSPLLAPPFPLETKLSHPNSMVKINKEFNDYPMQNESSALDYNKLQAFATTLPERNLLDRENITLEGSLPPAIYCPNAPYHRDSVITTEEPLETSGNSPSIALPGVPSSCLPPFQVLPGKLVDLTFAPKSDSELMLSGNRDLEGLGGFNSSGIKMGTEPKGFERTIDQSQNSTKFIENNMKNSVLKKLHKPLISMLQNAQTFEGSVFFAINIGRVLLENLHKDFMLEPFSVSKWESGFPCSARNLQNQYSNTVFSNMLTSSGDGIDFVSNLKVAKTTRMFEPAPYDWGISYEFMCIDLRSEIDILMEKPSNEKLELKWIILGCLDSNCTYSDKLRYLEQDLGSFYWHFPKRNWDARLHISGSSLKDPDDPLFRSIAENLYIPPNLSSLEILTKSVDKNLDIRSVRLKRHLRYLSTQEPNIVLNIIENQDLALGMNNDGWTRAIALPTEDMKQDNRIWFTASITSIVAEEKLKGNCNLELGEAATWNPNEFLDERIVESMYNVAKEVVKRIDSVGLDQRIDSASIGLRESMSSRPGSANGDPATGEFW